MGAADLPWSGVRDWCTAFVVLTDVPAGLKTRLARADILKCCSCSIFAHYYCCHHVLLYAMSMPGKGRGLVPKGWSIKPIGGEPGRLPKDPLASRNVRKQAYDHEDIRKSKHMRTGI